MEFVAILIKWATSPLPHINMVTDNVQKWFMSQWIYHETAELTFICIQIAPNHFQEYMAKLMRVIRNLWSQSPLYDMEMEKFDELLKMKTATDAHKYSITRIDVQPRRDFYDHITNMKAVMERFDWKLTSDSADSETILKLKCYHKPHHVTVMLPGLRMIIMHCRKSQRICDLMQQYDLMCANVWDTNTCLSGRAPCMALVIHDMNVIYVDKTPYDHTFDEKPEMSRFNHNMHPINVKTKLSLLRFKPYHVPTKTGTSDSADDDIDLIVYCESVRSTVNAAIKEDGRFLQSARYKDPNGIFSEACVFELEGADHIVVAALPLESITDGSDRPQPFACCICYKTSDAILQCGHLFCNACTLQVSAMAKNREGVECSLCKQKSPTASKFIVPRNFSFKCNACCKPKQWVANCSHLTCTCYGNGRCSICNEAITRLQRVFI